MASKDPNVYKDISFYPRPLVVKNALGEVLLKAALQKNPFEFTSYNLEFTGVQEDESFKFLSKSGSETMSRFLKGPIFMNYMPGISGAKGGLAKLEISFDDGAFYKMYLPWGVELFSYKNGRK